MWRRGPFWAAVLLAGFELCGCSTSRGRAPSNVSAAAQAAAGPSTGNGAPSPASPEQLQRDLAGTKQRIADLEQQLGAQEKDLAQAREETGNLRQQEHAARSELRALQAHVEQNRAPYVAMAASSSGAWEAYQERSAQGGGTAGVGVGAGGGSGAGGSSLVATLRQKLIDEREQRVRLERQLERLKAEDAEMSAGPFENKMQNDLAAARKQIDELKVALQTERKARQDLAERYEQLQVQFARLQKEIPLQTGPASEEIAALEARQRRVLASIERDLLVSRQRESELRSALEAGQGTDAVPLASAVSNLRAQNDALQTRLDDEHRNNRELSAKLNLAGRVTDLIFKMRNANTATAIPSE